MRKVVFSMSIETAEFVIYIINELANIFNISTSKVFGVLDSTSCIDEYLVPFYDVLHTMSSSSVAEDVIEYIKLRGSSL